MAIPISVEQGGETMWRSWKMHPVTESGFFWLFTQDLIGLRSLKGFMLFSGAQHAGQDLSFHIVFLKL